MAGPREALRTILPIAGWSDGQAAAVEFTGRVDPVLPTPFRIGTAGAATIAASGLAAAELWQARSGRRQRVTVDLRQATASLRSSHYIQLADAKVSTARNTIMGVYPTRDGRWSYLHCNFPNHRAAALGVLGVAEDRDALARAVATWNAADLEEAIIAAKGAGGMARTQAEWAKPPQAAAIAALPLMEIMRIGDSAPEPLPPGDRPLAGIRVLDLTRVIAGPTCARTLAEHGVDVLKITAAHLPNLGYQEWDTGHGKLSAELDLRTPGDVDTLRGLVRHADIFSQGYRPGTLAGRGLSPEELAALRPGLVYVSLSAFGHAGPWAARRGFDTVVQTVSGITTRQAESLPGETLGPQFYPVSAIDYCTGYLMAFGAMSALTRRAREGGSWLVRISLAQVGKWIVDLGEVPTAALEGVPAEFTAGELERWSTESATPAGRLRHLKPAVQLSETPPYWARPSDSDRNVDRFIGETKIASWTLRSRIAKLQKPEKTKSIKISISMDGRILARTLAKIAHCHLVAERGLESFVPFLPPIILGQKKHIPHLIGSEPELIEPSPYRGHYLGIRNVNIRGHNLIVIRVRLFPHIGHGEAKYGPPIYLAVAGELIT